MLKDNKKLIKILIVSLLTIGGEPLNTKLLNKKKMTTKIDRENINKERIMERGNINNNN